MTYEQKSAEEWGLLEKFRELLADFPKGKVIKSESPDFIVSLNPKRNIGIELTWVPGQLSMELIEETIARKEEKLRLYHKKKLNLYWLILMTGGDNGHTKHQIDVMLGRRGFSSLYQRVFLFYPDGNHIFEIK